MDSGAGNRGSLSCAAAMLAVCACVLVAGAASAGAGRTSVRATPEIDVYYLGGDLQMKVGGATIRTGGSIPAGSYMVVIYDDEYPTPDFTLSGPGVSIETEMNSTQMGGLLTPTILGPYSFQTGATYRIQDKNLGAGSSSTFTTTAAAAPSTGGSTSTTSSPVVSTGSGSSGAGSTTKASSSALLGTLQASISVAGKQALKLAGKTATTLRAGRYRVVVDDRSTKAGLVVGQASKHPITLSGASAIGKTTHRLTLGSGRWFLESSSGGAKTYFTVR